MNVHVLQHVPFEGIGSMEPWLRSRDATLTYTRFYESADIPSLRGLDLVIVMGGPMSVNDETTLPWLAGEKQFLRNAIEHGVAVLGICLGAQLIASALGARVCPNSHREIGWFDIESTSNSPDAFRFPERIEVFHWHGETFDLPAGALHLARSAGCENQAFQVGANVIGLQCHLELTPVSAHSLINHCREEIVEDTYVRSEASMRSAPPFQYEPMNALMVDVLEYLIRQSGKNPER